MRQFFSVTLLLIVAVSAASAVLADQGSDLAAIREWTAPYHRLSAAMDDGYILLPDCMYREEEGAMGVHYVNPDLLADTALELSRPEAVIYEPGNNGQMKLVAVEFVIFQEVWENEKGVAAPPPTFLGQEMELKSTVISDGNLLPPLYELHVWVWRHNPHGIFADWNPNVSCSPG